MYFNLKIIPILTSSFISGALNVNIPNLGTLTPLPIFNCLETYRPFNEHQYMLTLSAYQTHSIPP